MTVEDKLKEAGGSLDDLIQRVRDAWRHAHRGAPEFSFVTDVFEDVVIVKFGEFDDPEQKWWRVPYTLTEEAITFADASEWEAVTLEWRPVSAGDDNTVTESLRGLIEATTSGNFEAIILVEGESANGNVYTEAALKSGIPIFSGSKMYIDHPTMTEESQRPERSVRDLVGKVGEAFVGKNSAGKTALKAPITISEHAGWLKTLVKEGIADGLSIRAAGRGKANKTGKFVVESFVQSPHTSVDFVTVPAAGGKATLIESHPGILECLTCENIRQHRPDLIDAIREADGEEIVKPLRESETMGELDDLKAANAKLEAEKQSLAESAEKYFREARNGQAAGVLASLMTEAMPEATVEKLKAQAKPLIEAFATHGSEQTAEQLTEALKALVEDEKKYLARVMPHGTVFGLDESKRPAQQPDDTAQTEALVEAFTDILGNENKAKIAAKGRS